MGRLLLCHPAMIGFPRSKSKASCPRLFTAYSQRFCSKRHRVFSRFRPAARRPSISMTRWRSLSPNGLLYYTPGLFLGSRSPPASRNTPDQQPSRATACLRQIESRIGSAFIVLYSHELTARKLHLVEPDRMPARRQLPRQPTCQRRIFENVADEQVDGG
jgi:hypothetical protein